MDHGRAKSFTSGIDPLPRCAIDTNILAYAEGLETGPADLEKVIAAQLLLDGLFEAEDPPCIAAQTLAELFHLLVRKGGFPREEAARRVTRISALASIVPTHELLFDTAMQAAVEHRLQIYDAIALAAAAEAQCEMLMSEDLHHGFAWRGVTVVNPFAG